MTWNRCDICGKFISFEDFQKQKAVRTLIIPDSYLTRETYKTLCKEHAPPKDTK